MTAILQLISGHLVNFESQRGFLAWLKSVGLKTRANFGESGHPIIDFSYSLTYEDNSQTTSQSMLS
jgi:spore maturation protein CgeB